MQLLPITFWRLTLAEWRGVLDGYSDRMKDSRRQHAWNVSHLLIAAGCTPDKVTPAKLLGLKEPRGRKRKDGGEWLTAEHAELELARLRATEAQVIEVKHGAS
jgi:hypothetical protein